MIHLFNGTFRELIDSLKLYVQNMRITKSTGFYTDKLYC